MYPLRLILLLLSCCPALLNGQADTRYIYIERYKDIAMQEMTRAGIPASIKLAQGLLESGAGTSHLSKTANNHFGIKCGSDWTGKKLYKKDDDFDASGQLIESCFRVYKDPEESFIAHSEFLRDPRKEHRYGFLFRLDPLDYKSWARGLKISGYATNPVYDSKLVDIIERYELHKFDKAALVDDMVNVEEGDYDKFVIGIFQVNDLDVTLAQKGDTPDRIATRTSVPLDKIMAYNEQIGEANTALKEGTRVYLEPKRSNYRTGKKYHYVQEGETMYDIAQLYGIRLDKLYAKNNLPMGAQPAKGEQIRLRGAVKSSEAAPQDAQSKPSADSEEIEMDDFAWPPDEDVFGEDKPEEEVPVEEGPFGEEEEEEPEVIEEEEPVIIKPPVVEEEEEEEEVPPVPDAPVYHEVIKGDTLYSLSRRYQTTVDEIRRLNGLPDNNIKIGQRLRVK